MTAYQYRGLPGRPSGFKKFFSSPVKRSFMNARDQGLMKRRIAKKGTELVQEERSILVLTGPRGNFLSTNQKHYQDLGSARHQYGISALVTQTSFCEGSSGDLGKRRLFAQASVQWTNQKDRNSITEIQNLLEITAWRLPSWGNHHRKLVLKHQQYKGKFVRAFGTHSSPFVNDYWCAASFWWQGRRIAP